MRRERSDARSAVLYPDRLLSQIVRAATVPLEDQQPRDAEFKVNGGRD